MGDEEEEEEPIDENFAGAEIERGDEHVRKTNEEKEQ